MIYTGVAFAARSTSRSRHQCAVRVARFRSLHGVSGEPAVPRIAKGYEDKTKHKVITLTYYGQRMVTANKAINKPKT